MENNEEALDVANEMESVINAALVFKTHPNMMHCETEMMIIEDEEEKSEDFYEL